MVIIFQEISKEEKKKVKGFKSKINAFMLELGVTINSYKSKYDLILYISYI
jgi:hypothetical protein